MSELTLTLHRSVYGSAKTNNVIDNKANSSNNKRPSVMDCSCSESDEWHAVDAGGWDWVASLAER